MALRHEALLPTAAQAIAAVQGGTASLPAIERRLAPAGERAEPRPWALRSRRGLLSSAARQHRWPWAESRGAVTPEGCPPRRGRARWEPEAGRDAWRPEVMPQLADAAGVWGSDATGVLPHGPHAAGVARPYRGPAGRSAPGQSGVCRGDARPRGQALRERAR